MAIVGILSLIICVLGGILYLALTGMSKTSWAEIGRIMFAFGLLAFLIGSGAQSCSIGTGGAAVTHGR
jgi:hypothetical protein